MDIQSTETTENSAVVPVTSTETTESLDQSTVPVGVIDHPQTAETLEQSPPLMQTAGTSPLNAETTEHLEDTALPEVTNTNEAEPLGESMVPEAANTETAETVEQSTLPSFADTKSTETMEAPITDNTLDNLGASENHLSMEMRHETAEEEEEIRNVLKEIAATGKFWYEWETLRSMLSLHLKQVISEYPQTKMTIEEQKISLGETHTELVKSSS